VRTHPLLTNLCSVRGPSPAKRMTKLAKPNYQHEKRQKDLAKKKKKEEKLRRKADKANAPKEDSEPSPDTGETPVG
jgi:hypothetical protein